jgi:arginine exporter protein ArgO
MSGTAGALLAGLGAGYGIAMPLGAIGVLIVHEGLARGWRCAAAAASGTALVDLGYVCLALAAGATVTHQLQGWTRTIQLTGAAVLVAVVVRGLLVLRRTAPPPDQDPPDQDPPDQDPPDQDPPDQRRPVIPRATKAAAPQSGRSVVVAPAPAPLRTLRRFVGLTAINPLTAVYFVVLTAGLGSTVRGTAGALAFAVGVFTASWSWQLALAATGALAGARLPGWARTATSLVGYAVVLGYAVHLCLRSG